MPAPLSVDLRQRILDAYQAKEGSQRQLAGRFKVSLSLEVINIPVPIVLLHLFNRTIEL